MIFSSRRLGVGSLPTHSRVTPGYSRVTPGYSRIDSTLCRATFDVQFAHLLQAGCAVSWRACLRPAHACPGGRRVRGAAGTELAYVRRSPVAAAASSTGRAARGAGSLVVPYRVPTDLRHPTRGYVDLAGGPAPRFEPSICDHEGRARRSVLMVRHKSVPCLTSTWTYVYVDDHVHHRARVLNRELFRPRRTSDPG